jgi:DNA mismatch repair protein MutL
LKPSRSQRIKRLSIQLANQIAAGEVVERPASVLKELLENSIDAGSDNIEVDIIQGGKSLIRVKDNGLGITKEDLPLAVSRHATSKLNVIEDLHSVSSLGFRGEALASISSISRLSITSKFDQSDKAWCIDTSSDSDFTNYQADILPAALSSGTLIEVRDLFYNTPARRKFLRTDKTEFRYIEDVFKRIVLSHFNVSFKITHNKKLTKKLSAVSSPQQKIFRLQKIFGENIIDQLKEVNETSQNFQDLGSLQLSGWISNTSYFRSQADQQFFYVNGRYVRDKLLNHALRQAYQETLPAEQYAAYILYLTISPDAVDVNVHPTKHEVRFRQSRMVHDFIVSALRRTILPAVINSDHAYMHQSEPQVAATNNSSEEHCIENYNSQNNLVQKYSLQKQASQHKNRIIPSVKEHSNGLYNLYNKATMDMPLTVKNSDLSSTADSNTFDISGFKGQILAVLGSTLVAQEEDSLWMIDSLKAIAMINNDVLISQLLNNSHAHEKLDQGNNHDVMKVLSQKLLIPENIHLTQTDCDLLIKRQQLLQSMGVEFTLSGSESLMLRSLPKLPFSLDVKLMMTSIVDLLTDYEKQHQSQSLIEQDQFLHQIGKKIAFSSDPLQIIDKNKQQIIINYISQLRYSDLSHSGVSKKEFNKIFRILNSSDMTKIIESS